jgi:GWxTD domain-containing protein
VEISATVLKAEGEQVWQKNQLVDLRVKDFSQTVSLRLSSIKQFSAELPPGKYDVVLQTVDQESKKSTTLKKQVIVRDYSKDSLSLSDIMLAFRVTAGTPQRNVVPNLTGSFERGQDVFFLFFEVYNRSGLDSVHFVCTVLNSKQKEVAQRVLHEKMDGQRMQIIWQMDSLVGFSDKYILKIDASSNAKGQAYHAASARSFSFRMKNLPSSIVNLDKAIDQLLYIAKESEIDAIRESKNEDEKLKGFLEYWSKHDPDPKTVQNELMEEYYARVAYAEKNFANYREGWRTDRGMVIIRFGYPQNIDRHPFDSESKPYEIWYYYEQNREFIFIDDSGFGDYRLQYPTTDLWGRIR